MDESCPITVEIEADLMPVVPEYLENRRRDCEQVMELLSSGSLDQIKALAHRMKGSGGSYGFDDISEIGEALEMAAINNDHAAVRSSVRSLGEYLDRVKVTYYSGG